MELCQYLVVNESAKIECFLAKSKEYVIKKTQSIWSGPIKLSFHPYKLIILGLKNNNNQIIHSEEIIMYCFCQDEQLGKDPFQIHNNRQALSMMQEIISGIEECFLAIGWDLLTLSYDQKFGRIEILGRTPKSCELNLLKGSFLILALGIESLLFMRGLILKKIEFPTDILWIKNLNLWLG